MNILQIITKVIKENDPNKIYSFNIDLKYAVIKDLWENYLNTNNITENFRDCFEKTKIFGSIGLNIGILNIYNVKDNEYLFGLFYCNNETKYLKIKSKSLKKILNEASDYLVLTYIIKDIKN